ncbi:hypothetical protein [Halobacillus ihumii]|uniref:hypothetical protein n=1 Tax=Halobacillus ihumii TaxID=2686092 RepID=UPI0013D0C2EA|nr:hypothetical protein [Halobacillus ihumii]
MKAVEVLLLIIAMIGVGTYLFYKADYIIYIALAGGIGFSILHFIRTYDKRRGAVLGNPDAKYYRTFDTDYDDFSDGVSFTDESSDN